MNDKIKERVDRGNLGMELFGIESKFNFSNEKRTYVYLADNEEHAKEQFLLDPNHSNYQKIEKVYKLKDGICDLSFQLFRNILKVEQRNYRIREIGHGLGDWGTYGYELLVDNIGDLNETVRFKPHHAHCDNGVLQLMVCTDGYVPNWLY